MRQPSDFITWLNDAYAMELSLAEVLGRHARPVGVCRQTLADETRMAAWQQDHILDLTRNYGARNVALPVN